MLSFKRAGFSILVPVGEVQTPFCARSYGVAARLTLYALSIGDATKLKRSDEG